ncbi:hypothetical protein H100_04827 [Trichophyton rubrum MR850]|nr:hypothetical protein H100_04827 [Trichophyton rubrum MR850]
MESIPPLLHSQRNPRKPMSKAEPAGLFQGAGPRHPARNFYAFVSRSERRLRLPPIKSSHARSFISCMVTESTSCGIPTRALLRKMPCKSPPNEREKKKTWAQK